MKFNQILIGHKVLGYEVLHQSGRLYLIAAPGIADWRRQWCPTPVLLPGNSHGRRSLVGCSPWGCSELDMTERLHFHFSLSCIGEGNGNPLQCSCLENPRDGEPGGLPSMELHRVGHDWSDLAAAAASSGWAWKTAFQCQELWELLSGFT